MSQTRPGIRSSRAIAIVVVALLATAFASIRPPRAAAEVVPVDSATLSWSMSYYVANSGSLKANRFPTAPTTLDPDTGVWTFQDGTGTHDQVDGSTEIDFPGAMEMGNTAMGNFALRFSALHLSIDADIQEGPNAALSADLGVRQPGAAAFDDTIPGVVIAYFDVDTTATTWTVTPDTFPFAGNANFPGARQFPPELTDALPAQFRGFFQQTSPEGNATNDQKLPSPLTISLGTLPEPTTTTSTTTSTTSPTPPPTVPDAPVPITSGQLDWGVKASFISYIATEATGTIDTIDPATRGADDIFHFTGGSGTYAGVDDLDARFDGGVHVTAHKQVLDITIENPTVIVDPAGARLVVDATYKELIELDPDDSTPPGETFAIPNLTIATLDMSAIQPTADGDDVTFSRVPTTLTAAGVPVFGNFYAAGDLLDPVTFTIHAQGAGTGLPETVEPQIGCLTSTTVVAGSTVTLCADGFTPGEQVQAFLHSEPVWLGVTTADARGHAELSVVVPADTTPGEHRFELRGVSSRLSVMSRVVTIVSGGSHPAGDTTLPRTGSDLIGLLSLAFVLLVGGSTAVAVSRRRGRPIGTN